MKNPARTLAVPFVLAVSLALAGCAGPSAPAGDGGSGSAAVEVDEGLFTVDVTIARSLLDAQNTMTDGEIEAAAAEKGMAAKVAGDTVTYTMTKAQRDDMLAQMRESAAAGVDELVADDSNSLTGVEVDDDLTHFRVSVDGARYSPFEAFLVLGFYMQGALYQQFSGVGVDDVDVVVEFIDDATGEVIETGTYKEMRANLEG
ncbi:hypothetical protein [Salinibacterium sp. ZJ70]|uniref:hypothetical protein n=1 Tax=Salinibacterium sp. ZJ70 TaxID=2708084 RepID=UPI00142370F5|nr:hypothetical protein [Salinibacterium sp. ZJ70]